MKQLCLNETARTVAAGAGYVFSISNKTKSSVDGKAA